MNFFNSLTLDLKVLIAGLVGCALVALVTANKKTEKGCMIVFAVLAVAGIYRFTHLPGSDLAPKTVTTPSNAQPVKVQPKLESTFAR